MKVHVFSSKNMTLLEQPMKVSLFGTSDERDDITLTMWVFWNLETKVQPNMNKNDSKITLMPSQVYLY